MEVKVVNMEVKPPFVCFTMGWFVDNRLEAHRVDDKKFRREGNVRIRRWQQISKHKRISGFKASQMHELKPNGGVRSPNLLLRRRMGNLTTLCLPYLAN